MAKGDKKDKEATSKPKTAKQYAAELGFALDLINSDPSLQKWIGKVRKYMKENDNRVPTAYELDEMKQGVAWFDKYNAYQEEARMFMLDPRRDADWKLSLKGKRDSIQKLVDRYGLTDEIDSDFIDSLALEARLDNLSDSDINSRFTPILENAIATGADLSGTSAEYERNIVQWADRNGLSLSGNTIAKYVAAGVEGKTTIDDIKNDLRRTSLSGSYPAWSDRIMQGDDPADIAAPYKQRMARLLEIDEGDVDLNDELLQKAMQGVGADGKPSVVPLYSFDQQIREDDRWQYTDNAMDVYANAGNSILKMFGLR